MIRINLLGRAKGQKGGKRSFSLPRIPNVGLLLAALILVIEGAIAFQWSQQAAEDATRLETKTRRLQAEIDDLTKVKTELDELRNRIRDGQKEKAIFDELYAEKIGPASALTYLSFILAPRREAEVPGDELKQMELAGWRVNWPGDQARAWITSFRESAGEVTLVGSAVDHGDVAELTRRLESSAYFRDVKLVWQERKPDRSLNQMAIDFTIRGILIYLIEPARPAAPPPEQAADAKPADGDATDGDAADTLGDGSAAPDSKLTLDVTVDADVPEVRADVPDVDVPVQEVEAERDAGPPPIVPKPVAPSQAGAEGPTQGPSTPIVVESSDPPPADKGIDPSEPPPAPSPQPAPSGNETP